MMGEWKGGKKNLKLEAKPNERCEKWERVNTKEKGDSQKLCICKKFMKGKNAARQHEREMDANLI